MNTDTLFTVTTYKFGVIYETVHNINEHRLYYLLLCLSLAASKPHTKYLRIRKQDGTI